MTTFNREEVINALVEDYRHYLNDHDDVAIKKIYDSDHCVFEVAK